MNQQQITMLRNRLEKDASEIQSALTKLSTSLNDPISPAPIVDQRVELINKTPCIIRAMRRVKEWEKDDLLQKLNINDWISLSYVNMMKYARQLAAPEHEQEESRTKIKANWQTSTYLHDTLQIIKEVTEGNQ